MNEKPEKLAVVINETIIGSIIKDFVSFLMFGGLMYFNHAALNGNGWIDLAFILIVFLWLASRNSKSVFKGTKLEAIKWLQEKEIK